jgi:glycosyltransferase involved in cell wall biosynthesis
MNPETRIGTVPVTKAFRPSLPLINIAIPLHNEEETLHESLGHLVSQLSRQEAYSWTITLAENGSTDRTHEVSQSLAHDSPQIRVLRLERPGRGRALKAAWAQSQADVLVYMDADLSADLEALPQLLSPLANGTHDIAIGSRLIQPELTTRRLNREVISRCYNWLIRLVFNTRITDAQCAFKAITKAAAHDILPLVKDDGWFMDSELLLIAEHLAYRIFELPVRWVERRDSRVRILPTAIEDIKGLFRLRRTLRRIPRRKV